MSDDFNKNKNLSFELFQLSVKLIDNLFIQNSKIKNDKQILDLMKDNEQSLKYIKINDLSLKIKDIYNKNKNDEKYLNQIIDLYQSMVNLIKDKDEIEYINDFETLYKLGNNVNYLLSVLFIMNSLYAFTQYIDFGNNINRMRKLQEFERKMKELNKSYEESKNVNIEYFKNDYTDEEYINIEQQIINKYNEDKEKNELTKFSHYILENHPPVSISKSMDEFKKKPSIKILVASYSKSITKKYGILKNKEKLRVKINEFVSEMFSNNIELKPEDNNGEETDSEGENIETETVMTNYTPQ